MRNMQRDAVLTRSIFSKILTINAPYLAREGEICGSFLWVWSQVYILLYWMEYYRIFDGVITASNCHCQLKTYKCNKNCILSGVRWHLPQTQVTGTAQMIFIYFISNIFIQGEPFSYTVLPWCPVTVKYINIRNTYIHIHIYKSYIKAAISW